jgi:hypothetical protein
MRKEQSQFALAVGKLILFAYDKGFELTFGDTYPSLVKHIKNSFHGKGLAIDLNLFKDNKFLSQTSDHKELGDFWESLGGTWGGHWGDGNHYSWGEGCSVTEV